MSWAIYILFGIARLLIEIMNSNTGVYIAIFYMPKNQKIQIGRFGRFRFRQGVYLYVGSAQRNLSARLERHNQKKKILRWHIDYLSAKAEMLGAITIPGPRKLECKLAKKFSNMFEPAVPGFGASDCRCRGHLFYTRQLP
jgi:sugar fermentation stimulation protein A